MSQFALKFLLNRYAIVTVKWALKISANKNLGCFVIQTFANSTFSNIDDLQFRNFDYNPFLQLDYLNNSNVKPWFMQK